MLVYEKVVSGSMQLNELLDALWNFVFNALNTKNVPFLWLNYRRFTPIMINLNWMAE